MHTGQIYAVVISYCSDPDRLVKMFDRLLEQVTKIVWVDNGSSGAQRQLKCSLPSERIHAILLHTNQGIGAAQNHGIEWALAHGATHVLLMDDDSLPDPRMVHHLLRALAIDPLAGAVGACYADPRRDTGRTPFCQVQGLHLRWFPCDDPQKVWQVDHLIASGCLIPADVLRRVGLMRADFFIDWVDTEWCLRAGQMGYRFYGVCAALLEHNLGDRVAKVLGREIPLHAPWRHYYQSRNFLLMLRSLNVGAAIKFHMAYRQFKRFIVFSTLVPSRWRYFRMWILGAWHGICGRSGALFY